MKKISIVLLAILGLSTFVSSQEIVTNIINEGTNSRDFVFSYESKNYLVQVLTNDELSVYQIFNSDSLIKKSSRILNGINYNSRNGIQDKYFVYSTIIAGDTAKVYDLIDDKVITIEIPQGYKFYSCSSIVDDNAIIIISDSSSHSVSMIYNFNTGDSAILNKGELILKNKDNLFFIKKYIENSDTSLYYIYNLNSQTRDTLLKHADNYTDVYKHFSFTPLMDELVCWYISPDGYLNSFEYSTSIKNSYKIPNSVATRNNSILQKSDKLYIISRSTKQIDITIFDTAINKVEKSYKLKPNKPFCNFKLVNDKLVGLSESSIIVIDVANEVNKIFKIGLNNSSKINVVGSKYVIYDNHDGYLGYIDVESLSQSTFKSDHMYDFSEVLTIMKLENEKYLISFIKRDFENRKLFFLDLDKKKISYAKNFETNHSGIHIFHDFFEVNDQVYLIDENLYLIKNHSAIQINKNSIRDGLTFLMRYKIQNDKLYYFEYDSSKTQLKLMYFDGKNSNVVVILTNHFDIYNAQGIEDFIVTDNFLYFISYNRTFRYDINLKSMIKLPYSYRSIALDYKHFFSYNNNFFYRFNDKIYRINKYGATNKLDLEMALDDECVMFNIKDKIFSLLENKLYEIEENNIKLIFEFPTNIKPDFRNRFLQYDNVKENLLFFFHNNVAYHFDGKNIKLIPTKTSKYRTKYTKTGLFVFHNDTINSYFDTTNKDFGQIESIGNNEIIYDIFTSKGDTFLITLYHYKTKIYKSEDKFKNITHVKSINNNSYGVPLFSSFGDSGILLSGKSIYFMDENLDLIKMKDLKRPRYSERIIEKDSFFYFVAENAYNGQQVYRYKIKSKVQTNELPTKNIVIYPNPANNYIKVLSENNSQQKYIIYNNSGQLIKTGSDSKQIDISNLSKGFYYLILEDKKERSIGIFIKE